MEEIRRRNVTSVAIHNRMQEEIGFAESAPYDIQFLLSQLDAANQTIAGYQEALQGWAEDYQTLQRQVSESVEHCKAFEQLWLQVKRERDDYKAAMNKLLHINPDDVGDWTMVIQSILNPPLAKHAPRQEVTE